jgi:hypothetical protein
VLAQELAEGVQQSSEEGQVQVWISQLHEMPHPGYGAFECKN